MLLATCPETLLSGSKEGPCTGFFLIHSLIFYGKCLELVLRIAGFIIFVFLMSYTPKRKKKPRVKISWKQEGNKKVGVNVSAEESMCVCV
jgi:hypothetical protein